MENREYTPIQDTVLSNNGAIWDIFPFVFRINETIHPGQTTLTILEDVCKERGWKEFGEADARKCRNLFGWNLWWKSTIPIGSHGRALYSWQYTNHIPKAINFCNKEYLAVYVARMEDKYGELFRFCPKTYTIPREREELQEEHSRRSQKFLGHTTAEDTNPDWARHQALDLSAGDAEKDLGSDEKRPVWICKPLGKSQGKGIILIDDLTNLPDHPVTIVQEYIQHPLLISGYKFDLRLYVAIVSVSPLTIYVYREGLTRFSTEHYDLSNLQNVCSHLTNVSLNKFSPGYEKNKDIIGTGCKWTLRKLRQHLISSGYTDWYLWQHIMSIIVLTILGEVENQSATFPRASRNCFEFLGYDILIDSQFRPWLLETNLSPGLGGDCAIDEMVKRPMLHDLFDLLGLPDYRRRTNLPSRSKVGSVNGKAQYSDPLDHIQRPETVPSQNGGAQSDHQGDQHRRTGPNSKRGKSVMSKLKKVSSNLQARLEDAQQIYSQPTRTKSTINNKVPRRLPEDSVAPIPMLSVEDILCQLVELHNEGRKEEVQPMDDVAWQSSHSRSSSVSCFTRRSWYNAPEKFGDWIRVFPFNTSAYQISRGYTHGSTKYMVKQLEEFLIFAKNECLMNPNQSDDYYNMRVRQTFQWNKHIWSPPV